MSDLKEVREAESWHFKARITYESPPVALISAKELLFRRLAEKIDHLVGPLSPHEAVFAQELEEHTRELILRIAWREPNNAVELLGGQADGTTIKLPDGMDSARVPVEADPFIAFDAIPEVSPILEYQHYGFNAGTRNRVFKLASV